MGEIYVKLECGQMPNVMAALPNIGGALCSTPQSFADVHPSPRRDNAPVQNQRRVANARPVATIQTGRVAQPITDAF